MNEIVFIGICVLAVVGAVYCAIEAANKKAVFDRLDKERREEPVEEEADPPQE